MKEKEEVAEPGDKIVELKPKIMDPSSLRNGSEIFQQSQQWSWLLHSHPPQPSIAHPVKQEKEDNRRIVVYNAWNVPTLFAMASYFST